MRNSLNTWTTTHRPTNPIKQNKTNESTNHSLKTPNETYQISNFEGKYHHNHLGEIWDTSHPSENHGAQTAFSWWCTLHSHGVPLLMPESTKRRQSTVIVMALHHKSASLNPTELDGRPPWSSTQILSSISIKISLMHPCLFSPPTSSQSPFHLSTAGVLIALVISMVSLEISSLELIVLPREVLSNNSTS